MNVCTLPQEKKRKWTEHLPELVYAYNVTPHSATGYSLHYLLFDVEPYLPLEALLGQESNVVPSQDWRQKDTHVRAKEFRQKKAAEHISILGEKIYCPPIEIGQSVYLSEPQ